MSTSNPTSLLTQYQSFVSNLEAPFWDLNALFFNPPCRTIIKCLFWVTQCPFPVDTDEDSSLWGTQDSIPGYFIPSILPQFLHYFVNNVSMENSRLPQLKAPVKIGQNEDSHEQGSTITRYIILHRMSRSIRVLHIVSYHLHIGI